MEYLKENYLSITAYLFQKDELELENSIEALIYDITAYNMIKLGRMDGFTSYEIENFVKYEFPAVDMDVFRSASLTLVEERNIIRNRYGFIRVNWLPEAVVPAILQQYKDPFDASCTLRPDYHPVLFSGQSQVLTISSIKYLKKWSADMKSKIYDILKFDMLKKTKKGLFMTELENILEVCSITERRNRRRCVIEMVTDKEILIDNGRLKPGKKVSTLA